MPRNWDCDDETGGSKCDTVHWDLFSGIGGKAGQRREKGQHMKSSGPGWTAMPFRKFQKANPASVNRETPGLCGQEPGLWKQTVWIHSQLIEQWV